LVLAELPEQDDDGFYRNKGLTKLGELLKVSAVANYSGQSMRHISISPGGVVHIAIGSSGLSNPNLSHTAGPNFLNAIAVNALRRASSPGLALTHF
jgi:hypothetical protein